MAYLYVSSTMCEKSFIALSDWCILEQMWSIAAYDEVKTNAFQLCKEGLVIANSELELYSAVMGTISLIISSPFEE